VSYLSRSLRLLDAPVGKGVAAQARELVPCRDYLPGVYVAPRSLSPLCFDDLPILRARVR
jgi:hypothetical protein